MFHNLRYFRDSTDALESKSQFVLIVIGGVKPPTSYPAKKPLANPLRFIYNTTESTTITPCHRDHVLLYR